MGIKREEIFLPIFIVTNDPLGYDSVRDAQSKDRVEISGFLDLLRRRGMFARLIYIENVGDSPIELAHVRNGILYEGMTSQIDWVDLAQVVDIWEKAKQEILNQLDGEKTGQEFSSIVDGVILSMGLPQLWFERLKTAVIKMRPDIESNLVTLVEEWPSIPPLPTDNKGDSNG